MELEPQIALDIVKNLKDIINHEINLFDTSGIIIASTDESRVGSGHDGALVAARTKEVLTIDHDNQFEGAKKGINVPVLFKDSVVAIIGITGNREEVEPYGNIIKKMTEILIRENWIQITHFNRRMNYTNLINMLISEKHDQTMIDYLTSILNIGLNQEQTVIVGKFVKGCPHQDINYEELSHLVNNRMIPFPKSFFSVNNQSVHIIMEKNDEKRINEMLASLIRDIEKRFRYNFVFGIGNYVNDPEWLWRSYQEANTVINWSIFEGKSSIKQFNDLDIELLFASISNENAKFFIQKVLGNVRKKDIDAYEELLSAYTYHNGSITKGAEELFIHKNTFQNKLNKLHEETGYNPRNLSDYIILETAFSLRNHLKGKTDSLQILS